jgi:oligopeptidase B
LDLAWLRTVKAEPNPLLLVTNMEAGHGKTSGSYEYLKEAALNTVLLPRELRMV